MIDFDFLFHVKAHLNDLLDYRDLASDLWDGAKVLIDLAVSSRVAGQHDFADQLCIAAQVRLFDLAVLADVADPLSEEDY